MHRPDPTQEPSGPSTPPAVAGTTPFLLRALRYRNYRLYFFGQGTSLVGSWMTRIATSWLVYELTHSAILLGWVNFASQIPMFMLAPIGGVLVDRWNRRTTLVITQVLATLQSFALAYYALRGTIRMSHIIVLSVVQGLINAFDNPARQAFVPEVVEDRADLSNAIALNSSMIHASRLLGPAMAGYIIRLVGAGWCFFVDGISYFAVIAALLAMRIKPRPRPQRPKRILVELHEGLAHSFGFAPIRAVLVLVATVSLMGSAYTTLMPVIADALRPGDARIFGMLMACAGLGALSGAIYLAARRSVVGLGLVVVIASGVFGLALMVLAFSHSLWLSAGLMYVLGAGMIGTLASSNTIIQTIVDDDKRGRVMSFFAMSFLGMAPFGSLLAGTLAEHIGTKATLLICGISCLIGCTIFAVRLPAMRRLVRPIYVRKGILPEVAEGMKAAAELTAPPQR